MFLAEPGEYEACGMFTSKHFILILVTVAGIAISLKRTINKSKEEVTKIIKNATIVIWIFEILRIGFNFYIGKVQEVNEWMPLYYCSMLLYAGLMSSFGKGKVKRAGDVFLATGGIVGGTIFILFPTTTLPTYPALHFLSLHSFFFHGMMIYLGLLINATHYITLELKDIWYFASLVGIVCIVALTVNAIFDTNLMFISNDFPGTPISVLYHLTGKFFTPIMMIGQMTLPFFVMYKIIYLVNSKKTIDKGAVAGV